MIPLQGEKEVELPVPWSNRRQFPTGVFPDSARCLWTLQWKSGAHAWQVNTSTLRLLTQLVTAAYGLLLTLHCGSVLFRTVAIVLLLLFYSMCWGLRSSVQTIMEEDFSESLWLKVKTLKQTGNVRLCLCVFPLCTSMKLRDTAEHFTKAETFSWICLSWKTFLMICKMFTGNRMTLLFNF